MTGAIKQSGENDETVLYLWWIKRKHTMICIKYVDEKLIEGFRENLNRSELINIILSTGAGKSI